MATPLKTFTGSVLPVVALFALLMTSLWLMSDATENAERFGRLYIALIFFNGAVLLALVVMIGMNLFEVLRQAFARAPGSRLTLRLIILFIVLALVPVSIVYWFSVRFLDRGIDSWFDVRVEQALENALELSQAALDERMRDFREQTREMARRLQDVPDDLAALTLNELRQQADASEIYLIGDNNHIIATSSERSEVPVPPADLQRERLMLASDQVTAILEPLSKDQLLVRTAAVVPSSDPTKKPHLLVVRYRLDPRISELAQSVQQSFTEYKELAYLRKPLKQNFILTLSLVLLLGVLFAVWAAFFSARRLMAPIRELAEGTRAVAAGEYHKKLVAGDRDELGFLVRSFNEMTTRLSLAYEQVDRSKQLAERQRAYLQTVLEHISSGVLTLDEHLVIRTANAEASRILESETPLQDHRGRLLEEVAEESPLLARFWAHIRPHLEHARDSGHEWQDEVIVFGASGRKILICRGAVLPAESGEEAGHVVVFDDVTDMIQAQRDAAWGEVARRLAHEIKNPLTPIQLSAERLGHKLAGELDARSREILERAVRTIVSQVEAMKTMVNAFSEYARSPRIELHPVDLNALVAEVVDLYRNNPAGVHIEQDLDPRMPMIEADPARMRQVLNNLIKNALEALEGRKDARITVSTRCMEEAGCRFVELLVADNGPGISEEVFPLLFEPYVTDKPRGSGLGLAIVKKVIEEHGGIIWAQNAPEGGARIFVRLPVVAPGRQAHDERAEEA